MHEVECINRQSSIGKQLLLGVTGGIAAYKATYLIRLLRSNNYSVRVVMTQAAQAFITPLSLQVLSGQTVFCELMDKGVESGMGHIALARWAEQVLIAPATANFIARLAHGLADDLLSTVCLATTAPIVLAPAMNQHMWQHPATQANIALLRERGVTILGPTKGEQACGDDGPGRMLEPEDIVISLKSPHQKLLHNVQILLTAGPTREPIDPVRYISNRSSGRMGYALAQALLDLGAEVCIVSGPVAINAPTGALVVRVETALEMQQAVQARVANCQIFIATAAVADYRVAKANAQKFKKDQHTELFLHLVRNPDILSEVTARSHPPFTVGFAAETENVAEYALAKLQSKGLAMLAANLVGKDQGFEVEDNALLVLWPGGQVELPHQSKITLAQQLALIIADRYLKF